VSVVVAVTVLILGALAAVVYLTAVGRDVSPVLLVLSSLIAPTIASFVAIRRLGAVKQEVSGLAHKSDARIDNLITDKSNLEQQAVAAGLIPVTAKVSWDPESTGPLPRVSTDTAPAPAVRPDRITASEIIKREGFG